MDYVTAVTSLRATKTWHTMNHDPGVAEKADVKRTYILKEKKGARV